MSQKNLSVRIYLQYFAAQKEHYFYETEYA